MTALVSDKAKASEKPKNAPRREIPVLFHLMDVGRQKQPAAPQPPVPEKTPVEPPSDESPTSKASETGPAPSEIVSSAELRLSPVPETKQAAPKSPEPKPPAIEFTEQTLADIVMRTPAKLPEPKLVDAAPARPPSLYEPPPVAETKIQAKPAESPDAIVAPSDPVAEAAKPAEAPKPADDAVTLRQRASERQRQRQTAAKDDWFASQGKYIAIAFVFALIATIWLARSNRTGKPAVATGPHAHPGAAAEEPGLSIEMPTPAAEVAQTQASEAASETPTDAQAEIHPPSVPQLAASQEPTPAAAAPTTANTDPSLFPWGQRQEATVAARPESAPPTGDAPANASPPATTTAPGAEASPAPADSQPLYPNTNYRADYPIAPPATPATATPQQQYVPAAPTGPTLGPAANATPPNATTTASGSRYERTGSGLY